mmetsp:Transcript_14575/g.13170  ORF Transcript_14575/g.13170 Transcript_14575/m.13170 type:complete len:511 (-) Transcript_14575:5-1537(-)
MNVESSLTAEEIFQKYKEVTDELNRIKEELNRTKEELNNTKESNINESIWKLFQVGTSLPELQKYGTRSNATTNYIHTPVDHLYEKEFGLLAIPSLEHCKSKVSTFLNNCNYEYSTEIDIYAYIKGLITDIIFAAKLEKKISLKNDLSISDFREDFWVVMMNGFPLCTIEVKKPGRLNNHDQLTTYGQQYDYMLKIRAYHGLRCVIGIYTNYDEWVICWFEDSDDCGLATTLDYGKQSHSNLDIPNKRTLHCSKVFNRSNSMELSNALYSALQKASYNAGYISPVPLHSVDRVYILVCKEGWFWTNGNDIKSPLDFNPPKKSAKNYYLLRDFHGGSDGRVWLSTTKSGKLAVIKFLNDDSSADKEVEFWHLLGFDSVYHIKLNKKTALVLPFAFHYNNEGTSIDNTWWKGENTAPAVQSFDYFLEQASKIASAETALQECIKLCAKSKLIHEDIEWRHVAMFPNLKDNSIKCCFLDLTRMNRAENERNAAEAMNEEFLRLKLSSIRTTIK